MYLLGYLPKDNRLYLGDKELNVVSYSLLLSVLEYQTVVMRADFAAADKILPSIPKEQRNRVAHFLEKQGFQTQALSVSTDPEHKFDLCLKLKDTKKAFELAIEAQSEQKWKLLAELAMSMCHFELAQECLHKAQDYPGLLLLATCSGNSKMLSKLGESSQSNGINNVAFLSYFIMNEKEKALQVLIDTNRLPEAAFFARAYLPSHVSRIIKLWKESVINSSQNERSAQALANPIEYENLFPGFLESLKLEQYLKQTTKPVKAQAYRTVIPNEERNLLEEMTSAERDGDFLYESETFEDATEEVESRLEERVKEEGTRKEEKEEQVEVEERKEKNKSEAQKETGKKKHPVFEDEEDDELLTGNDLDDNLIAIIEELNLNDSKKKVSWN